VVLLILESLGSTELIFILIMALVFFGPRKLPQISRSLGKNLADFRRVSEEFKRTWDKEATLEDTGDTHSKLNQFALAEQNSILGTEADSFAEAPAVATSEQAVARDTSGANELQPGLVSDGDLENVADETRPAPKSEWL
jgi:Sec-independent protein translocase protein TatA